MSSELDVILNELRATREEIREIKTSIDNYKEDHGKKHDDLIRDLTILQEAEKIRKKMDESYNTDHDKIWNKLRALEKKQTVWNTSAWILSLVAGAAWAIFSFFYKFGFNHVP